MAFRYPCPDCKTTNIAHQRGCEHEQTDIKKIRKAYMDIVGTLTGLNGQLVERGDKPGVGSQELIEQSHDWYDLHNHCFDVLQSDGRIEKNDNGYLMKKTKARHGNQWINTILDHGPVDGCKNDATVAVISYCSHKGTSWSETKEFVRKWLKKTGSWMSLSWSESSISELCERNKHIHTEGMQMGQQAKRAVRIIEQHRR